MTKALKDKIVESLTSILPIALIVALLAVTLTPIDSGTFVLFTVGVFLLIFGMGAFTLGADMSMLVIGEKEVADGTVAVRHRSGTDLGAMKFDFFNATATTEIYTKERK